MIIGHKKILKLLEKSVRENKVSHAYLFSGPVGVGKFTVALDFAEKLTGRKAGEISPDLAVLKPEIEDKKGTVKKRAIKIEKIRELQHDMALSGSGGKYRVVIIDEADMLNTAAQNSFLKTLEEPMEKVVIILIVQDEKKILSTIRSRCQRIRFGLVRNSELEKEMTGSGNNKAELLFWSLGRPGFMKDLSGNPEELDFRKEAMSELLELLQQSVADKFLLADKLSKDINIAQKKLNLWSVLLRETLLSRKNPIKMEKNKAMDLIAEIEKSLGIIKNTNSNPRLVLESLFLSF